MTGASLRRALVITAIALAGLLLIVSCAAAWLLGTESGLRFALARATPFLPAGIEIGAVDGEASGPLIARDLRFETEAFTLTLDRVELEWRLAAVLGSEIVIDRLYADGLRIAMHERPPQPEPEADEPFAMPERIDLPVDVFVADARLRDISIHTAQDAEPLIVDALQLEAQWTDRALEIAELQVDAPLADLQATAEITPRDEYRLAAELTFTLRPPDYAPLEGITHLSGNLANLELEQTLAAPYNLRAEATLRDVVQDLSFEALVDVERAYLVRIGEALPAATASAQIRAQGNPSSVRLELTAQGVEQTLGEVNADFQGELSPERIAIDRLIVELPDTAAHLEATGRVELAEAAPTVDVAAQWTGLQWPVQGAPQVASESGRLSVAGTLENYRAQLDAALSVPNQADGRVKATGSGNAEHFAASTIDIATLDGTVNGTANVSWAPMLAGNVDLRGRGLDPGGLLEGWNGKIDFAVQGEGRMPDTGPEVRVQILSAEGRLRGQPVELDARGSYANDTLELTTFTLRSGSTEIEADGRVGEELALDWTIASEDLGSLLPAAGGELQGRGSVSGAMAEPAITAEISASDLRYAEYELASMSLDADVDVGGDSHSELELELRDGKVAGIELESLSLNGSGTRADHTLGLEARTSAGRLDLGIDGNLDQDLVWAFVIDRLDYAHPDLSPWSLRSPASGELSAQAARLDRLCLESGEALLCAEGTRSPAQLAAAFELRDLPLALVNPFLPAAVRVDGALGGTGSIEMARTAATEGEPAAGLVARVDLDTTPIHLLAEDEEGEMQELLAFAPGDIALDLSDADGMQLALNLPLETQGGVEARASIAAGGGSLTERPLDGHLLASLPDIGFLTEFAPQVDDLAGRLEGDLSVSGSLAAPALDGSLELLEGAARLPGPQIRLRDVQATVRGRGAGHLDVMASARSGDGTVSITGRVGGGETGPRGQLEVKGDNFRAVNTPEARVRLSPDLAVTLADNRLEVTGMVSVPFARIELTEAPASAVDVSDDQVIVQPGEDDATATRGMQVAAEVRVMLGEEVSFEGFGLTADLAGDLTVIERPGDPTTATGEISVKEGHYQAYGQNLEIQRGRVLFVGGPIDRPGINVRAVRRPAEDILVGVEVRGTLRQPDFSVFSEPPMSESEQLSYLVLGRPLQGGPESENSALARAALALGIKGGNFLTEQFGSRLRVDQIGIETEPGQTNEQAALVLGKYLSPKLYVSYGVGLLEPVSTLKLRYALSSKWRLVTESSSVQSGGDILYTIER